ncbi:hypothetical protein Q8A73_012423 [Channa argus]|nr:hypothetical protein Q8A73_012423 [Channa argus]
MIVILTLTCVLLCAATAAPKATRLVTANLLFVSLPSDLPAALLCSAIPSAPRLHGSFSSGHHSTSTCDSPPNRSPPHKASSSSDQPLRSPDIGTACHLQHAVSSQGALLAQHDHRMLRIEEALDRNSQQLSQVTDTLRVQCSMSASSAEPAPPPQPPTAPAVRELYVPPPEPFSGDLDKCRGFLLQCRLVFAQQPQTYASDAAKVAYVVGLLRGRALEWAEAKLGNSFLIPFHTFVEELRTIFDHPARSKNAADRLLSLRQGFRSVADFSVEFRVLATEAQWDDAALRIVFRHGLSDPVKDELTHRDPPDSLDELIELAIRLDNRIRERRRERGQKPASVPQGLRTPPLKSLVSPVSSASAPSELPAEPWNWLVHFPPRSDNAGFRLVSGSTRHFIAQCPSRPKGGACQGDWGA